MITPIIKPFAINATDKEIWMALGVLFILSSLLPTMNQYGAGMTGYMMLSTPYIFIYLLGYGCVGENARTDCLTRDYLLQYVCCVSL